MAVTAESFQSQVQRPLLYQQLLKQRGSKLHILSLQGYIFFGVGDNLLEALKARLVSAEPDYVVLDFRLVSGIDSSAMLSLSKIKQLAEAHEFHLVLTGLRPELEARLRKEAFGGQESDNWRVFPELDMGVAWCEEQLIQDWESVGLASKPESLRQQWLKLVRDETKTADSEADLLAALVEGQSGRRRSSKDDEGQMARLEPYLEQRDVEAGDTVVEEMERFNGLLLVESGQVMVQLVNVDGSIINVKLLEAGNIIGELGQYAQRNTRLAVIATEEATVFVLPPEKIKNMETADPPLAIALHRLVAAHLSERNLQLDEMAQALQF
jgi:SulP family sulfate permease